ncbi:MAG: hypothetical protein K0R05_597 [Anaerocolumna sp.]|jgi:magnesium-transporting ATPase (P-type)|nr:hypothetical protein [Anaerocolumna sp.]
MIKYISRTCLRLLLAGCEKGMVINMKNLKRIGAILIVVLLLSLYGLTLYAGLTASPDYQSLLMASLYSTTMIPLMLYAYMLVYRLLKKRAEEEAKRK